MSDDSEQDAELNGPGNSTQKIIADDGATIEKVAQVQAGGSIVGNIIAGGDVIKKPELEVVEGWTRGFFHGANEYLSARFFQNRNLSSYRNNVLRNLGKLKVIGKEKPLELENVYIALRISEYQNRDFIPDEFGESPFGRIPVKLAESYTKSIYIDRAISLGRQLAILGDPGSGKTTLLKHLTLRLCNNDEELAKFSRLIDRKNTDSTFLPVLVVLNDLASSQKSLFQYIEWVLKENGFPYPGQYLRERLYQGKCFILLDGLDEVAVESTQDKVIEQINAMVNTYGSRNYFIVSSRIAGFRNRLADSFIHLEIVEFGKKDIETFIKNWFKETPDKAQALIYQLEKNRKMLALASNPLLLSIITVVFEQGWKLPDRRVELYEECALILCDKWDQIRRLHRPSKYKEKWRVVLEELAYKFFTQPTPKYMFSREDLINALSELLPLQGIDSGAASQFLREVMEQTGLLRQKSRTTYDFVHLTLQEYFVACAIKRKNEINVALSNYNLYQWHEVILLLAGILRDATDMIDTMLASGARDAQFWVLLARCLTDADKTNEKRRKLILPFIIAQLLEADDIIQTRGMEEVLELLGEKEVEKLKGLVDSQSGNTETLLRLANIFGIMGSQSTIPQLVKLIHNQDLEVAERAAVALVRIGQPSLEHLLEMLDIPSTKKRKLVVKSLGDIGDPFAAKALYELIKNDPDSDVQVEAILSMGKLGEPRISRLIQPLLLDPNPKIRESAAWTLGNIGNPDATLSLMDSLRDVNPIVVEAAGNALHQLGSLAAVKIINTLSLSSNLNEQMEQLAMALGYTGSRDAIPSLRTLLLNNNPEIRLLAAKSFGLIKDAKADDIEIVIRQSDPHKKAAAALALGYMGGKDAVKRLSIFLKDNSPQVAIAAALANNVLLKDNDYIIPGNLSYKLYAFESCYEYMPEVESVYFLLELQASLDNKMLSHARDVLIKYAQYLNRIGFQENDDRIIRIKKSLRIARLRDRIKEIINLLSENLSNDNQNIRNVAAETMAQFYYKADKKLSGIDRLEVVMFSFLGGPKERLAAVHGLLSRKEITMPFLLESLTHHTDPRVVEAIALGIGNWSGGITIGHLEKLLNRNDTNIQIAALRSLGKIAGKTALPTLLKMAYKKDLDTFVRIAWINALSNFDDDRIAPLLDRFKSDKQNLIANAAKDALKKIKDKGR